jgi:signal transduction histidine kinase
MQQKSFAIVIGDPQKKSQLVHEILKENAIGIIDTTPKDALTHFSKVTSPAERAAIVVFDLSPKRVTDIEQLVHKIRHRENASQMPVPLVLYSRELNSADSELLYQAGITEILSHDLSRKSIRTKIANLIDSVHYRVRCKYLAQSLNEPYYKLREGEALEAFVEDHVGLLAYEQANILKLNQGHYDFKAYDSVKLSKANLEERLKRVLDTYRHLIPEPVNSTMFKLSARKIFDELSGQGRKSASGPMKLIGLPVVAKNNIYAIVEIGRRGSFDYEEMHLFSSLLNQVTMFIENRMLISEVRDMNEKLREFDLQKNEFLKICSHELKNPMGIIKGYIEFMEEGLAGHLSKEQTDIIGRMRFNVERLLRLTNDILDFQSEEEGKITIQMRLTSLKGLLEGIAQTFEFEARQRKIALSIECDKEVELAYFDSDRISQVLTNLVHNAIKFVPGGGEISIYARGIKKLHSEPTSQSQQLFSLAFDQRVQITVDDTGPGIPESELPYVFTRKMLQKYIGQKKPLGHGLGLFICKEIVEEHHGKIWVESRLGKGTKMIFELPVDERIFDTNRLIADLKEKIIEPSSESLGIAIIGFQIHSSDPLCEMDSLSGKTLFREYVFELLKSTGASSPMYQFGRTRIAFILQNLERDRLGRFVVDFKKSLLDLTSGGGAVPSFDVKSAISEYPKNGKKADSLITHLIKQLNSK